MKKNSWADRDMWNEGERGKERILLEREKKIENTRKRDNAMTFFFKMTLAVL